MNRTSAQGPARLVWAVVAACLLEAGAWPAVAAPLPEELAGRCAIEFSGSSTLHGFEGSAPDVRFPVRRAPNTERWRAEIDVPVERMTTGNRWRDSNMRKMFDAKHYPIISASFPSIDPAAARPGPGGGTGILPFTLQIRQVRRSVTGIVRNWRRDENVLTFDVQVLLSLRDFGLKAPRALGFIKVHDAVLVSVHATVSARPAAAARGRNVPADGGPGL